MLNYDTGSNQSLGPYYVEHVHIEPIHGTTFEHAIFVIYAVYTAKTAKWKELTEKYYIKYSIRIMNRIEALRSEQNGPHVADVIFKCWKKICGCDWQQLVYEGTCDKPLLEPMMNHFIYTYYRLSIYRGCIWNDSVHCTTIIMIKLRSDLHSRTTPHTSPLRASYRVSFEGCTKKNGLDLWKAYCIWAPNMLWLVRWRLCYQWWHRWLMHFDRSILLNGVAYRNSMMTSYNGNIFRVTGPLCGKFNGIRWIPRTHKGQWRGALMFSLICAWINGWVNNGEAADLRRLSAHYDVIIMSTLGSATYHLFLYCITKHFNAKATQNVHNTSNHLTITHCPSAYMSLGRLAH